MRPASRLAFRSGSVRKAGLCRTGLERATKCPHSMPRAMQKGLAIGRDWSGTVGQSRAPERSEILPRRLQRRGGASVVRRQPPQTERRISMSKSAKKRLNCVINGQRRRDKHRAAEPNDPKKQGRSRSKQSRVIAMLRSPTGATIAAIMGQPIGSSTRSAAFLPAWCASGSGLKLRSEKVDGDRVYRIAERRCTSKPSVRVSPARPSERHATRTGSVRRCRIETTLDNEIARLRDLDVGELRARWHTVFGRRATPHLPRHLLFRILAYRLQADRLGELDADSRRLLDRIAGSPDEDQPARG